MASTTSTSVPVVGLQEVPQLVGLGKGPLDSWNLTEPVGIKRMPQVAHLGASRNDVSSKLYQPDSATPDLRPETKAGKRRLYELFRERCQADPNLAKMGWTLVLFTWEIYKGKDRFSIEWGQLVFVDKTATKWFLLSTWDYLGDYGLIPAELDFEEMLRCQSQRWLNALSYVPGMPEVEWIRSTFTTIHHPQLHPLLFDFSHTTSVPASFGTPCFLHLTSASIEPCFSEQDLTRINGFLKACTLKVPHETIKQRVLVPDSRSHLHHPGKPYALRFLSHDPANQAHRACQGCNKLFSFDSVKYCTGCFNVFYCSTDCQKKRWKSHKSNCVPRSS